mmetsp:Transcript_90139/g.188479  ORF Transcript_90139/g.188479 Transcript_90139/m.188479 type:complete len:204 (+) Transcript_90139:2737-3348(+)
MQQTQPSRPVLWSCDRTTSPGMTSAVTAEDMLHSWSDRLPLSSTGATAVVSGPPDGFSMLPATRLPLAVATAPPPARPSASSAARPGPVSVAISSASAAKFPTASLDWVTAACLTRFSTTEVPSTDARSLLAMLLISPPSSQRAFFSAGMSTDRSPCPMEQPAGGAPGNPTDCPQLASALADTLLGHRPSYGHSHAWNGSKSL